MLALESPSLPGDGMQVALLSKESPPICFLVSFYCHGPRLGLDGLETDNLPYPTGNSLLIHSLPSDLAHPSSVPHTNTHPFPHPFPHARPHSFSALVTHSCYTPPPPDSNSESPTSFQLRTLDTDDYTFYNPCLTIRTRTCPGRLPIRSLIRRSGKVSCYKRSV